MTILLVSDSDDSAFACNLLAEQLRRRGQTCLTVGQPLSSKRESPLPLIQPQIHLPVEQLHGSQLLEQASAIGLFLRNPERLASFIRSHRELAHHQGRRPIPIFSGPLSASLGDRLMGQLHEALCCDLLLLPGQRQLDAVEAVIRHWPESAWRPKLLGMGLWFLPERPARGSLNAGSAKPPHHLLALVQENAPTVLGGKSQLLRQLIQWAERSTDWSVVVQRDRSWERHQPWIPKFKAAEWTLPDNLTFAEPGQLLSHLAGCSACLGVSSPWALAAMAWGRQTLIVGDYGIHTNEGTTSWFGCGAMHRLQSIETLDQLLELPPHNASWLDAMGWAIHDGADRLIQALKPWNR